MKDSISLQHLSQRVSNHTSIPIERMNTAQTQQELGSDSIRIEGVADASRTGGRV